MKLEILTEALQSSKPPPGVFHCSEDSSLNVTGFSEALNLRELGEYAISVVYHAIAPKSLKATQSEMIDKINKWSNGHTTAIWVSNYPATMYGNNCYKVKIPRGAILIDDVLQPHYTSGGNHQETSIDVNYRYYLCKGDIPSKNFRPVSGTYLDDWEVGSQE
jgi:hypothetical protein